MRSRKLYPYTPNLICAINMFYISFQHTNNTSLFHIITERSRGLWPVPIPKHNHRERIILYTVSLVYYFHGRPRSHRRSLTIVWILWIHRWWCAEGGVEAIWMLRSYEQEVLHELLELRWRGSWFLTRERRKYRGLGGEIMTQISASSTKFCACGKMKSLDESYWIHFLFFP